MPQIQTYSAQLGSSGVPQGRQVSAADLGGITGQAMSQLGEAGMGIAKGMADEERRKHKELAKVAEINAARKSSLEAAKHYSDFLVDLNAKNKELELTATGKGGYTESAVALYDTLGKEYESRLGDNPLAVQSFQEKFIGSRDNYLIQSQGYEAATNLKKQQLDNTGIVENYKSLVVDNPHLYGQLKGEIRNNAKLLSVNPVIQEELATRQEQDLAKTAWEAMPEEQQVKMLTSGNQGGFDHSIKTVMKNEGGYTAVDGASGAPAIYGINRKWHPEAFDKAAEITKTEGAEAGKKYAEGFYKKEFWDRYNVGSLPANVQTIVMDGVVNHTSSFSKRLVEAASSESPEALIQMRLGEYRRLATASPEKYAQSLPSWENRLKTVQASSNDTDVFNDLAPELKLRATEKAREYLHKERQLIVKDPALYGVKNGLSHQQIVNMQQNPLTASVIPNDTSSQLVDQIKNAKNPEDVTKIAEEIAGNYGAFTRNALLDLKRAKLPDEHEGMISLHLKNSSAYSEHIRLLGDAAKAGDGGINNAYQEIRGAKAKDIDEVITEKMNGYTETLLNEGYSFDEVNRQVKLASTLAKSYLVRNPSVSDDDAISFAIQPFSEDTIADLNNAKFSIPSKYNASIVEDKLPAFYDEMDFEVTARQQEIASRAGSSLKELAVPFLSPTQDGLMFRAPDGEILLGKNGMPAELKFDDIISKPIPEHNPKIQDPREFIQNLDLDDVKRRIDNLKDDNTQQEIN